MSYEGLDPEIVDEASRQLHIESANLFGLSVRVGRLVDQATNVWHGSDSQAFAQSWYTTELSRVKAAIDLLDRMSTTLHTNVEQQIKASAAAKGSGGAQTGVRPKASTQPSTGKDGAQTERDGVYGILTGTGSLVSALQNKGIDSSDPDFNPLGSKIGLLTSGIQFVDDLTRPPSLQNTVDLIGSGSSVIGDLADLAKVPGLSEGMGIVGIVATGVSGGIDVYNDIKAGNTGAAVYDGAMTAANVAGSVMLLTPLAPAGAIILASTAAISFCVSAYQNNPAVKAAVDGTVNAAKTVVNDTVNAAKAAVNNTVNVAKAAGKTVVAGAKAAWNTLKSWF